MKSYKKFRIEAQCDGTRYSVLVKGRWWFSPWRTGFIYTEYFGIYYSSFKEAESAVQGYIHRAREYDSDGEGL